MFECKVNGEVWRPNGLINAVTYTYHEPTGGLHLTAKKKNTSEGIVLTTHFLEIGTYLQEQEYPCYIDASSCPDYLAHKLDTLSNHFISIDSFSKTERVIIGRFEFTAVDTECLDNPDTLVITEGKFKATY